MKHSTVCSCCSFLLNVCGRRMPLFNETTQVDINSIDIYKTDSCRTGSAYEQDS